MKKLIGVVAAALMLAASVFADPAEGLWKSIDDVTGEVTAVWKIWEENNELFGTIVAVVDKPQDVIASACKKTYKNFPVAGEVNKMKTVGTPWIYNMKRESEGNWKNGHIVNPGDGKFYGCVIKYLEPGQKNRNYTAKEKTLAMAGTVGPIQVFQYWKQATQQDIEEIQAKFPAENK